MSGFVSALIKQRKDAKKTEPDTNGRLKEIINIIRKQNYDNGITPSRKNCHLTTFISANPWPMSLTPHKPPAQ